MEHHTDLYQERRKIKYELRPLRLEKHHFDYVKSYIRKHKKTIAVVVSLIALQALIEIAALLFINSSMRERIYGAIQDEAIIPLIGIGLLGAIIYLAVTYFTIKTEREAVLELINDLRRKQYGGMLRKQTGAVTYENKADFLAKISYHLPLLSVGVDNSLFGCVRWVLSAIVLLALGLAVGPMQLSIIGIVIATSLLVGGIAYVVARYFVSQEVTAYSQVMRHIALSLSEFPETKSLHLERSALEDLDAKVTVDTYFRVRRDVWLRYFNRVLFTLLFVGGLIAVAVAFSNPDLIGFFYDPANTILAGIISLYSFRLLYEAARAGLYLPPAKLGLFLSVPRSPHQNFTTGSKSAWKEIVFKSNKVKLFDEGEYFKNLSVSIRRGKRSLFVGEAESGKTSFAQVMAGEVERNPAAWLVKIDDRRCDMRYWTEAFSDRYFFRSHFHSEKTIGEIILGKGRESITEEDLARIYALSSRYPLFSKVLSKKRFIGDSISLFQHNEAALCAIQAMHCIINDISLVIFDNRFADLDYAEIKQSMAILDKELTNSALVVFSRRKNEIIRYDAVYEIKKGTIQAS